MNTKNEQQNQPAVQQINRGSSEETREKFRNCDRNVYALELRDTTSSMDRQVCGV